MATTTEWFYVDGSRGTRGPVGFSVLQSAWLDKSLDQHTLVWNGSGVSEWTPIMMVPMLYHALEKSRKEHESRSQQRPTLMDVKSVSPEIAGDGYIMFGTPKTSTSTGRSKKKFDYSSGTPREISASTAISGAQHSRDGTGRSGTYSRSHPIGPIALSSESLSRGTHASGSYARPLAQSSTTDASRAYGGPSSATVPAISVRPLPILKKKSSIKRSMHPSKRVDSPDTDGSHSDPFVDSTDDDSPSVGRVHSAPLSGLSTCIDAPPIQQFVPQTGGSDHLLRSATDFGLPQMISSARIPDESTLSIDHLSADSGGSKKGKKRLSFRRRLETHKPIEALNARMPVSPLPDSFKMSPTATTPSTLDSSAVGVVGHSSLLPDGDPVLRTTQSAGTVETQRIRVRHSHARKATPFDRAFHAPPPPHPPEYRGHWKGSSLPASEKGKTVPDFNDLATLVSGSSSLKSGSHSRSGGPMSPELTPITETTFTEPRPSSFRRGHSRTRTGLERKPMLQMANSDGPGTSLLSGKAASSSSSTDTLGFPSVPSPKPRRRSKVVQQAMDVLSAVTVINPHKAEVFLSDHLRCKNRLKKSKEELIDLMTQHFVKVKILKRLENKREKIDLECDLLIQALMNVRKEMELYMYSSTTDLKDELRKQTKHGRSGSISLDLSLDSSIRDTPSVKQSVYTSEAGTMERDMFSPKMKAWNESFSDTEDTAESFADGTTSGLTRALIKAAKQKQRKRSKYRRKSRRGEKKRVKGRPEILSGVTPPSTTAKVSIKPKIKRSSRKDSEMNGRSQSMSLSTTFSMTQTRRDIVEPTGTTPLCSDEDSDGEEDRTEPSMELEESESSSSGQTLDIHSLKPSEMEEKRIETDDGDETSLNGSSGSGSGDTSTYASMVNYARTIPKGMSMEKKLRSVKEESRKKLLRQLERLSYSKIGEELIREFTHLEQRLFQVQIAEPSVHLTLDLVQKSMSSAKI